MNRLMSLAAAAALSLLLVGNAFAQGASCPIASETATEISGTTHTVSAADQCQMLVFTSGSASTATLPAASTLPAGFKVWIKSQGAGGVTITELLGAIDGAATAVTLTQGKGARIIGSNSKWYSNGIGVAHP